MRTLGHSPKPEWAKMKSVSELDALIGGPTANGVAYFKPRKPPADLMTKDPGRYRRAMDQYQRRLDEWQDATLQQEVARRITSGEISLTNGLLVEKRTGKTLVADYDLFEIIDANTGHRLSVDNPVHMSVMKELTEAHSTAIQHGAHMDWKVTSMKQAAVKYKIVWNHMNSEPLVRFNSDGSVWRVFHEPRLVQSLASFPPYGRGDDFFHEDSAAENGRLNSAE